MKSFRDAVLEHAAPPDDPYVIAAKKMYRDEGFVEIDDKTVVSKDETEQGAYVMAWVWVGADDV